MRYYAEYAEGVLTGIGYGGTSGEEVTEAEYNRLLTEIKAKAKWVDNVYGGTPIADVPKEWQEEIQRRVDEHIKADEEAAKNVSEQEIAEAIGGIL